MDTAKPMQERPGSQHHRAPGRAAPPRRRPSGEPPPLPHQLGRTGKFWLVMVGYFVVTAIGVLTFPTFARFFERWDTERLRWVVALRTHWLTNVMLAVNVLVGSWTIRILRWATFAALIVFRRWRHLFVFLGAIIVLEVLAYQISLGMGRPRPLGVTILAPWSGFSLPSQPVAGLAVTLIGMAYTLVVPGKAPLPREVGDRDRPRRRLVRPDVPGGRPAHERRVRCDPGRGGRSDRVPLVHAERHLPGHLPAGEGRPPGRRRSSRRGDRSRGEGPAGTRRGRDQAGRVGGIGRIDAASDDRGHARRRTGPLRVRQALREEPRPRRPLVQARPDDPVRGARGRNAVRDRPPVRGVRGLHAAPDVRRGPPRPEAVRHRRDHARARVHDRDGVLRRRRRDRRGRGVRPRDR